MQQTRPPYFPPLNPGESARTCWTHPFIKKKREPEKCVSHCVLPSSRPWEQFFLILCGLVRLICVNSQMNSFHMTPVLAPDVDGSLLQFVDGKIMRGFHFHTTRIRSHSSRVTTPPHSQSIRSAVPFSVASPFCGVRRGSAVQIRSGCSALRRTTDKTWCFSRYCSSVNRLYYIYLNKKKNHIYFLKSKF